MNTDTTFQIQDIPDYGNIKVYYYDGSLPRFFWMYKDEFNKKIGEGDFIILDKSQFHPHMEEATFTDKHDDNPELKGGQKDLPDELQSGILKKEGMDHEVSMAQASLKSIISSASELMNKIGNEEINLPGWIQGHITNAENYIDQANQGYHELEPSVKDIDAMDMVTEEVSANKKTKAKNALAIHLRSAMEDGNKENIEQVKDARDRINNTKSVDELVNILGEFGYKDDEIEDILG